MTTRVLRPVITLTTVVGILLAALAVYALLTAGSAGADSTFHPTTIIKYCNDMESAFPPDVSLSGGGGSCSEAAEPSTAGLNASGNPNVTSSLNIPKGDLNFSAVVTMTANNVAGASIAQGCSHNFASALCAAGTLPAGEEVGGLHSDSTLGTINNACFSGVGVDFLFFSVALPDNATDPRASTNITYPQPEGTTNRFGRWGAPNAGPIAAGGGTAITDTGTGLFAAGTNNAIQGYPSYLLDAFDPDFIPGVGDQSNVVGKRPIVPRAVYGGLSFVVSDWIPLFLVQFDSGALVALTASPLNKINANMGQPNVAVLQDPTASAAPSDITNFCTPLGTTSLILGTSKPNGIPVRTNPGPVTGGTTQFNLQYFASLRDLDQDSYENSLDSCPLAPNWGNPRGPNSAANGDSDGDGIDNACDTTSNPGVTDSDGDGYKNRLDNCNQISNGASPAPTGSPQPADLFQHENERSNTVPAADNGPNTDNIGDLCDTGSTTFMQNGQPVTVTLDSHVGNGRYMSATNLVAKCIGGTDADGDGYCAGPADGFDTGPHAAARHTSWSGATHPAMQMDTDGDKVTDVRETYMSQCASAIVGQVVTTCVPFAVPSPTPVIADGTPVPTSAPNYTLGSDVVHSCAQSSLPNNEQPWDNWGFDFNDDGKVSGNDLLNFAGVLGKTVDFGSVNVSGMGLVGVYRFDLTNDGVVSGNDLLALAPVFGKTCAQAGVPAFSQQ